MQYQDNTTNPIRQQMSHNKDVKAFEANEYRTQKKMQTKIAKSTI